MKIMRNKWLITNYALFAIWAVALNLIFDLKLEDGEFWLLIIITLAINISAAMSVKKDLGLDKGNEQKT
jgi:hypothetical protein